MLNYKLGIRAKQNQIERFWSNRKTITRVCDCQQIGMNCCQGLMEPFVLVTDLLAIRP